ncbi:protein bassoon isoform X3 [Tachysurus fulvidraco]|uniref:protein bassoon isoform X3 n=1 Tax=Tachysurus fulvidraco TaxID=1234273 RepID=UPI001FEDD00B|nr:protein bassoon isoform X3 [Tachysurus fulvidraco]
MGNEASLEGGEGGSVLGVVGAPGSVSASTVSGQHIKPVNGAAAGGGAAMVTGASMNRLAGAPTSLKTGYGSSGGVGVGAGLGIGGMGGMPGRGETYRLATHEILRTSPAPQAQNLAASKGMGTDQGPGQHASRRNLQVDISSGGSVGRSGRSPSVSPERGSAPGSPYSVPQIAPMPSSKLCPICNTTELTSPGRVPNFNKCTQCCTTVCNQCGFNPNPHLTEVQEWLCLNCQMQRALGMDMTTPRSKSQQQIQSSSQQPKSDPVIPLHSQPSAQPKCQTQPQSQLHSKIQPQTQNQASLGSQKESETTGPYQKECQKTGLSSQSGSSQILHQGAQTGSQVQNAEFKQRGPGAPQTSSRIPHPGAVPLPGLAKAPSQPDLGRASPVHHVGQSERIRSAGSSPARRPASVHEAPPQDGLTKLFGFGASLLNQASTLISVDPLPGGGASAQPSPARQQGNQGTKVIFSDANSKSMTGTLGSDKQGTGVTTFPQGPQVSSQKQQKQPHQQQQSVASHHQKPSQLPPHHLKSAQQQSPGHHQMVPPQQQSPAYHQKAQQQQLPLKQVQKSKVSCPLCKTEINIGSNEPPNYNSCTQCHTQVCNMCGFNPTPHLVEKNEWLCLNCQTQRLMSGGLEDSPLQVPYPSPKHQQVGSPRHHALASQQPPSQPTSQKVTATQQEGPNAMSRQQKSQSTDGAAPVAATVVKLAGDTKPISQFCSTPTTRVSESHQKDQAMPKFISESEHISGVTKKRTAEPIETTITKDEKRDSQRSKYYEEKNKTNSTHDLSRSPQSLSDTGYSSDGISSSHSEITGLIHEEEMKLSEKSMSGNLTPPSPSEITKLESSMRPLLESKVFTEGEKTWDKQHGRERHHRDPADKKHRSQLLSISQEQYDSDEDLEDILEEEEDPTDWEAKRELRTVVSAGEAKKKKKPEPADITDEEFMRRQIMEMSADEENEDEEDEEELEDEEEEEEYDEGYGYQKSKKIHKHLSDSGKEKRRLTHLSSSFEEESKTTCEIYKGSAEEGEEDLIGSQGGLRRFKTIELNNTNSYSRDMELNNENDLSLDREPELEMESLTGSPEERSRGDYSSTLPPTTSSYNSGASPTSVSSMEDDSDSSPSRRQRLEEAKQQRKARHRSHGPLLPTIEDSSEEDELREEEELLREQEKMREVEQQRIRSTARKTKRDKEELRAQRRRERSKTPPSNLSPIEDASPTEELRQAAEMEELHRSSCSEYSPSVDSETEGFEMSSKLYKSGSEYNLPTFMLLYSPTEKTETTSCFTITTTSSSGKPLKSAEEVYEEMMKKAEMLQKQQKQQQSAQLYSTGSYQDDDRINEQHYEDEYDYIDQDDTIYENEEPSDIYEEILQTSQNITKQLDDQVEMDVSYADKQLLDTGSAFAKLLEQSNALLTPGTSPTQLSAPVSFSETGTGGRIPDVKVTQHFSKDGHKDRIRSHAGKNAIIPSAAATTITAYGVYARDAGHVTQTTTSQTMTSQQSTIYGRHTASSIPNSTSTSSVSNKIAEITQAYNQREGRSLSDRVQIRDSATQLESVSELCSHNVHVYYKGSPPLSPTSPSPPPHIPARSPSRKTAEFSTQTFNPTVTAPTEGSGPPSPIMSQATQNPHRAISTRLFRQQSSQDPTFMVLTIGSEPNIPPKPVTVNTATSPLSLPTKFSHPSSFDAYSPPVSPPDTPPHQQSLLHGFYRTHKVERINVGTSMVTASSSYSHGSHSMENISLCRISTVPGTSRVEQGQKLQSASVTDLRTAAKSSPFIITDQGRDLTFLATESQKYANSTDGSPIRHSFQPLIMNLNTQEQPHVVASTATTVSVTVAASMFISQPKHPVVYGDPLQNRTDMSQGMGTVVCLVQNKPSIDPSIPNIDAKLEDLSIQQQQLLKQQQKLQHQQQLLEQQLQQHHQLQHQQASTFANLNLSKQFPLLKKDLIVTQTSTAPIVSAVSQALAPEIYSSSKSPVQPQYMMVQIDNTAQGKPLTQLIKPEESQDARDLTGQIKKENQIACCDIVYNLPFGGSCVGGPFSQKTMADEMTNVSEPSRHLSAPPQLYDPVVPKQDKQIYHDFTLKSYTLPFPARLQPSLSETNLENAGLQSYSSKPDMQASVEMSMDLNPHKHGYDGGFLGMGHQYGSYTDLRQGDVVAPTLPIRRYSSLSNISSDYDYSSSNLSGLPESNVAQYSTTTSKEISRMCAALNSMERYGSNPDLLQLIRGGGPPGRINLQQSLRPSFIYGPDGKPFSQALTSLINARQASLRAMFPSAIRSADGMIYSTINTPIASTVPITTQPTSVLHPLLRGVYRPYLTANVTPVPLTSLQKMPVASRMPFTGQAPYHFPTPTHVPVTISATADDSVAVTEQDAPIYLGKSPSLTSTAPTQLSAVQSCLTTTMATQANLANTSKSQEQPLNLSQYHLQTQVPFQTPVQLYVPTQIQQSLSTQPPPPKQSPTATASSLGVLQQEKEEENLHRQQENLLQLERERIELEKLRQLRLQEELERERAELQRHREKEHRLVQQEIHELQSIKQQVLQQQQSERESQLVIQREQLAQQKQQLDQIQSLQQQLQQHLEEQKRQKTAAPTSNQLICDQSGRIIQPQDLPSDMQHCDFQVPSRSLPNSASDMCLRKIEGQVDNRSRWKQRSMPRLQDGIEGEVTMFSLPTRIVDSSVQTDDEDEEEKYLMSRRRRTRRSVDCSVQTDDDEDKAEWEQPVRRRRSRFSRHSDSGADSKNETSTLTAKVTSSSIAIQTIQDCSCQTEIDQLRKISPAIHVTVSDPNKVEIVHYISGPERTQKGQSLACQTEPESHSQGVVVPQINVATTISPYSSNALVGSADPLSSRQQGVSKFERRKPDPLDIGYQQHHLHNESLSSVIRQPPKSPQVLYSPVSPSSPHRVIETSFSSSERLNKAHVSPQQKSYTAESSQRHQSLPRPIKNVQRSLSDPKPLSPTTDEHTKARISLYQQQALQSQLMALQQSSLLRKVKRTLPSPPPEETQLSMVTHALPQMYVPSLPSIKVGSRPGLAAKASLLKDLTHELKAVEQESTKLRKQQAELEEEEKEIDAKLRYLEMGITQRKETLVKERERRDLAYLRCMGDTRDYMSDSELSNLRLAAAATSESNGPLTRPSTAPLSQFTTELNTAAQFPPTSSFVSHQYPQSLSTATSLHASTFQSTGFSQPPYPTVSQAQAQPQPPPLQTIPHHSTPSYHAQGAFHSQSFPPSQPPYPTEHTMLPPTGFQPPPQPPVCQTPYPTHTTPYPSQTPPYPVSQASSTYQPLADILTVHQRPRQTSLADLEHKMPTNYEVISNPSVVVPTTTQDSTYSQSGLVPSYGQYSTAMASTYGPYPTSSSSTYAGYPTTTASSYGPYTTTSANTYGQYTTTTHNMYGHTTTTGSSYGQYTTTVANTYGQTTLSDHMHSVDNPSTYTGDGLYSSSNLEQNVPRNYVMIDDISELTKEGMGTTSDPHHSEGYGRHGGDSLHTRGGSSYGRPEDERDAEMYDHHHGRAYHLGQEETDWFEKPRDVRGSRHYSSSHSSSGRRGHVKHTYHDYDEPPEEDLWPQDDYGHSRHTSSREHRHHSGGSSGRHSSSRHTDEPRSSRSSRSSKDPSLRQDSRSMSSSSTKRGDSRSQGYHSSDYSRDPSGHHHGSRTGKQSSHHQGSSSRKQQDMQGHLSSSRQMGSTGSAQRATSGPSNLSRQSGSQQLVEAQGQRTQLQQQAQTSAARPGQQTPAAGAVQSQPTQVQQLQAKPGQTSPATRVPAAGVQPSPATAKPEPVTAPVTAIGAKAATPQPAKAAQPPLTGIGSKAAARPGGIGSAAAAQPGMEGESMLSKILPGGAAEQAGKLGEAISGFGKKFTSLW